MNDLLLRALRCESVPRPPIWLHRQAGRFLPEYRALRAGHSFRHLIGTPQIAAQITKLPIDLLGMDAAILFSDILVLAEVFGFAFDFSEGKGIRLKEPEKEVRRDVDETLFYVDETIRLLKKDLSVPLIGFCGGPYTVSTYMRRTTPAWLAKITDATIEYLLMQVKAGVDVIQIFDSWAGKLDPLDFQTLAMPYLKKIFDALRPAGIPITLFCRGSTRYVKELVSLKPTALAFDWEKEMHELRKEVPAHIAIQGNLDPAILQGPLEALQEKAKFILDSMKDKRGFIFNLDHEREILAKNCRWLQKLMKDMPAKMLKSPKALLEFKSPKEAEQVRQFLAEDQIYLAPPVGNTLYIAMTALHTPDDLDQLTVSFKKMSETDLALAMQSLTPTP